MVPGKFLSPADLPWTQAFDIYEPVEIIMTTKHKNLISAAFKYWRQVLKTSTMTSGFWSCVLYWVSVRIIFLQKKRYGMSLTRLRG